MNEKLTTQFEALISRPESELDLAEAALLIARLEYSELDVSHYINQLDEMANNIGQRISDRSSIVSVIGEMNRYLFDEQGFQGNSLDYFDPRNSFLNDVMERKLGVPISLSLIYLEVGQRLGIPFAGVSFPGHFLVKLTVSTGEIVLDPFYGGLSLSQQELESRLQRFVPSDQWSKVDILRLLSSANKREVLTRMLRNLKTIYIRSGDYAKALGVVQLMLVMRPGEPKETRDRGFIYERLNCFRAAMADYQHYLEMMPFAEDSTDVRAHYRAMQLASSRLN